MPELIQKQKKEMLSFPGLMKREKPEPVAVETKQAPVQEEAPKKRGRPKKAVGSEGEVAPKKRGVDPKKSKVIL